MEDSTDQLDPTTISHKSPEHNDELQGKVDKLLTRISELDSEKQRSLDEYNSQRSKMKALFLQKEEEELKLKEEVRVLRSELDEAKSQATVVQLQLEAERMRAQDELAPLQQLLNETLEANSRLVEEVKELRGRAVEAKGEAEGAAAGAGAGGGALLVISSLAKKVAAQLGADKGGDAENLEDSMLRAKEHAELIKSLVLPLEEEIAVLKHKLRTTDSQLQAFLANDKDKSGSDSNLIQLTPPEAEPSPGGSSCEQCSKLSAEVTALRGRVGELEREAEAGAALRQELEDKWAERREEAQASVSDLQGRLGESERAVALLRETFTKMRGYLSQQMEQLAAERASAAAHLATLSAHNEALVGRYNATAQQLNEERIDLPASAEQLQELWLRQRDQLIKALVGRDAAQQELASVTQRAARLEQERNTLSEKVRIDRARLEELEGSEGRLRRELGDLRARAKALEAAKRKLEASEAELKNRLSSLQAGLENGEAVQKDFVLLSQSLQKELELIRAQNHILRWEYEEDVTECRGCNLLFKSSKEKANCRHCGRIFCGSCLSGRVVSGPAARESRVCDVCHTLLNSQVAPYFSTEPPHPK